MQGGFTNMDSGRLSFDPSCNGNMFFLGGTDSIFRGQRSILSLSETSKTRPFFTSLEEMYDEEYYEEQLPDKKRRLTAEQVHLLEKSFEAENKLEPEHKSQLAKKLGLQPRQVAVWFQNRRARWKTKQLERDYGQLQSSYDSLMSDYDSILKENEQLKAEVISLTNKLQAKEAAGMPLSHQKPDQQNHADATALLAVLQPKLVKVEDRLSTGTGGSAVLDEDSPQLVDSGDSYFPNDGYTGCVAQVDQGVQSEEDEVGDDGRSYFFDVFLAEVAVGHHHLQEEGEPLGWWDWSS